MFNIESQFDNIVQKYVNKIEDKLMENIIVALKDDSNEYLLIYKNTNNHFYWDDTEVSITARFDVVFIKHHINDLHVEDANYVINLNDIRSICDEYELQYDELTKDYLKDVL